MLVTNEVTELLKVQYLRNEAKNEICAYISKEATN